MGGVAILMAANKRMGQYKLGSPTYKADWKEAYREVSIIYNNITLYNNCSNAYKD